MNRIFKVLSLASMLLIAVQPSAQGQNTNTEGSSQGKEPATVLDKVQYRVTYAARLVEDTTKVDSLGGYDYSDDDMRLDMGKTVSEFYSGRKAIVDKWMKEKMDRGERDFTNMPAKSSISWIVYRNYPEGETTTFDDAMMNSYRISEKTQTPQWSIGSDTCTILGYHCTKAETNFKGRHWTVWYAEDIPLDNGPWKLIGLPGLILKATDAKKQYIFEAKGLEQVDGKEDITLIKNYKKYESVTQKQFDKINRTTSFDDAMKASGITISVDNVTIEEGGFKDDFMKYIISTPIPQIIRKSLG